MFLGHITGTQKYSICMVSGLFRCIQSPKYIFPQLDHSYSQQTFPICFCDFIHKCLPACLTVFLQITGSAFPLTFTQLLTNYCHSYCLMLPHCAFAVSVCMHLTTSSLKSKLSSFLLFVQYLAFGHRNPGCNASSSYTHNK